MPEIKHLIFDLGGVIILLGKPVDFYFQEFDKKFNLPDGTFEKITRDIQRRRNLSRDFSQDEYVTTEYSGLVRFEQVNEFFEAIRNSEGVNQGLVDWIQEQRAKYQISILSNTRITLERLHEKFGIDHLFDHIFISSDLRLAKPDPEIFQHVLKVLGASPEECLFVDDSLENIESAKNLGFNVVLFEYDNEKFFEAANKIL